MNIPRIASVTALIVALAVAAPRADHDDRVTPPRVPADLRVDDGNVAFLIGHAIGTQNYVCLPKGAGADWALFTPQATLFNDQDQQVITHYFSPNPLQPSVILATWQHSRDASTVWGQVVRPSTDPQFVAQGAIAWLLVDVVFPQEGPRGGDRLTDTVQIQRVNTAGGVAPATGCKVTTDVGAKAFVPYAADYVFYKKGHGRHDDK